MSRGELLLALGIKLGELQRLYELSGNQTHVRDAAVAVAEAPRGTVAPNWVIRELRRGAEKGRQRGRIQEARDLLGALSARGIRTNEAVRITMERTGYSERHVKRIFATIRSETR